MPSEGQAGAAAMDKVNILLVDDQPAKLLSYEVILGELGENLIKANTPDEALGILLKNDVAVVLIDVVMPQIDGFQLAAMIREHPRFQKLAIIFVSGVQIADTDHLRGYEIGAVDYVTVPVVPEVLRAKVKVFAELYRKNRQLETLNAELEERVANRTAELEAQKDRLRQSEEHRSLALSAGDMGAWQYDVLSDHLTWDDGLYRIYHVEPGNFTPTVENVLSLLHPDDVDKYPLIGALKQDGLRYQAEFRVRGSDSQIRWFFGSAAISRDSEGRAVRLSGVSVDITDRKRAEDRQLLLAREVDHRAKNTLAVVLSVLRLTKARTTPEFVKAVEGRIHALAATHNLLSQTRWIGAELGRIVEEELAAYRTDHRERIVTSGPSAMLLPATAQALALALHELATNAAKYGALSVEGGQLHLRWTIGSGGLVLDWVETGGPPVAEPQSLGFGLTIVRSSIEAQFRGGVDFDWTPGGLRCRLSIPNAQIVGSGPIERKPPAPSGNGASDPPLSLQGRRLLMVEDEFLIAMMIKKFLEGFGATVLGPCSRLADAIAIAKDEPFDGALVDLNLAGKPADPLADLLVARGVPFAFVTGYQRESIDRRYANIPVLQKPIEPDLLERTLVAMLAEPRVLRTAEAD